MSNLKIALIGASLFAADRVMPMFAPNGVSEDLTALAIGVLA